jgi:hypothetical protein
LSRLGSSGAKRNPDIRPPGARFQRRPVRAPYADPALITPATREETLPVGLMALVAGFLALALSARAGDMMLYGDAVAHLGIARGILDTNSPGLGTLGGVWLPLPHLLMLPFIGNMQWWQNGMAGAWPSLICFVTGAMGMYRLARRMVPPGWALVATALFGLNANLLYLSSTAMTEPLFLALLVWIVLGTLELCEALSDGVLRVARNRLVLLGLLILGAVMTRYDGWILGAAVWCVVAWKLWKRRALARKLLPEFITFTLLAVSGPVLWFGYNHAYAHDWLDFMRGPYSAKEIDRKTSTPGAHKYWGWHNPAWSLMLYARTAQVDFSWWETGWLVAAASLWATWRAWVERKADAQGRAWLLLWLPLPFYVYSISYGSVPIFIPQLYPHSFYNSRYGLEMIPVLAVFTAYALWAGTRWVAGLQRFAAESGKVSALLLRVGPPVMLVLVVLNLVGMVHATPLVLKEAEVNSRGRLAMEQPLARELAGMPAGATILMDTSAHVGALQAAGIPLRHSIGPEDYYKWRDGLANPAATADYVVAVAGSTLAQAVDAHPQGLTELAIVCVTKQPCVRVYRSGRNG